MVVNYTVEELVVQHVEEENDRGVIVDHSLESATTFQIANFILVIAG